MKKPVPPPKGRHLTLSDRTKIETRLNEGASIRSIAGELAKSPSCISREIKKHSVFYKPGCNECTHIYSCKKRYVCGNTSCRKRCCSCSMCRYYCEEYEEVLCKYLENSPVRVCNACTRFSLCNRTKYKYHAGISEKKYREVLHNSRCGFDLTAEQFQSIDELVSPMIKRGLSPYVIKSELGDKIPVSEATLRRMIDNCELEARRIDLRQAVKRKPRKRAPRPMRPEVIAKIKLGHLYEDYLRYTADGDMFVVQMDCVEGIKTDRKVLLTLHMPDLHFQLAFIMEEHTSACVVDTLDLLEYSLGKEMYSSIFGVILTDNGHEFLDVEGMERSVFGGQRTKIFFCEPNRSDQKGACESNHKFIRYVIPKGTSLDSLVQPDVIKMMNHINSYSRKSLMKQTPYSIAAEVLPQEFFDTLGLEPIPVEELNPLPSLLN